MTSVNEFDAFSDTYKDEVDHSVSMSGEGTEYFAKYKARYIARWVTPEFSGKILDFGCGVGLLSASLREQLPSARVHGYDESASMVSRIESKVAGEGVFTSNLAELDRDYDLVVVSNVMHHIRRERRQETVVEIGRRLRRRGHIMVFEHNPMNPVTRWAVSRCAFDRDAVLLPPWETVAYLKAAGLGLVTRDYIVFFPRMLGWWRRLEPSLRWCPLGAQYVVVGELGGRIG